MELTGNLYGFYSNKPISSVFKDLEQHAKNINFKFKSTSFQDDECMFFFKDQTMFEHHDEIGYNTELNNEGCFNVEAKKTKLKGIATLFEFEGESDFNPFDINLVFTEVFYYVLTVPHLKEEDNFSQKTHDSFMNILG
ncbi:hypothetical protein ACFSX9_10705 [Flavobacterium ardleyense]|uniref:Uncharacterized protein n=1 Tax=Flavobacterium ardleyense TaxID=2038737 RepID=A0ABW5Z8J6_9FLAO